MNVQDWAYSDREENMVSRCSLKQEGIYYNKGEKKYMLSCLVVLQYDISEHLRWNHNRTTDGGRRFAVRFKTAPQSLPCWPDTPL